MLSSHNERVAARFAARAAEYDIHARLQADIAERLATYLPSLARPRVLEVGCGTGLFSCHLLDRYPDGDFLFTDLVPEMIERCRARFGRLNRRSVRFRVMDGEAPDVEGPFDLVVLSMTLQWFSDPVKGLQRLQGLLAPGGRIAYATIGPDCFPEWRDALSVYGLRHGTIEMPKLPGVTHQESRLMNYSSGVAFLDAMRAIGASTPRRGYTPLPPGSLRRALRQFERNGAAQATWQILYGRISPKTEIAA
jgi:malonyl-CoA O-methyltransferase